MKSATTPLTLAVIVACSFAGQATPQPKQSEIDSADRLLQSGKFAEAGKLYSRIIAQNPKDHSAILQLGRIALLSNRLDEAQKWLEKAKTLQPDDTDAKVMLAEVFYRQDDFQRAAALLKGVDVNSNKLIIEQYPTLNVAPEDRLETVLSNLIRQEGRGSHLDGERPLHGWLGSRGNAPVFAPVR